MRMVRGAAGKFSLPGTLGVLAGCGAMLIAAAAAEPDARRADSTRVLAKATPARNGRSPVRGTVRLRMLGRHRHGSFGKSAAEISAYDPASRRLFVVNAEISGIDILDISKPAQPRLVRRLELAAYGKPNSVAAHGGRIAVALSANPLQDPGHLVWLDAEGTVLRALTVGPQPDMVTISPDGRWALTANEGEPSDDYARDPEGSVSLVDLTGGVGQLTQANVTTLGFEAFHDRSKLDPSIRIYGPGASVMQDLEPEYIAVSPDSKTAWVSLQEANALAIVDIPNRRITRLVGLGFKDHSRPENALDPSDQDGGPRLGTWPVRGMYQPDAIRAFASGGELFLLTANEGDHRKYGAYNEEARVADLKLDPRAFPNASELARPENLGRLLVTRSLGDADGDGLYEALYSLGGRSFSVRSAAGELVYDSGSDFERILAERHPDSFGADQESNDRDTRSDNKGPEPEGITVGRVDGRDLAFIGLERHSGVMVYDLANPRQPEFVDYVLTRDFSISPEQPEAGDIGPEGLLFIGAQESPTGRPLLAVSYEISGTTTLYEITTEGTLASEP